MAQATTQPPRLRERYLTEIRPALLREFQYPNLMAVPKLEKVVLNIGLGEVKQNPRALDNAVRDLTVIAGQKPVVTKAQRSIAQFRLRKGDNIGAMVTLRGQRMYDFMEKLV